MCGIEASARNVTPESLARFLRLSAPSLLHESVHARTHAELGFMVRGVFEDEFLSFAYETWFMDGEADFATPEAYALGKERLDKYTPVYQRWKKADRALNEARREVAAAASAERSERAPGPHGAEERAPAKAGEAVSGAQRRGAASGAGDSGRLKRARALLKRRERAADTPRAG